jgi:hypothetical protein
LKRPSFLPRIYLCLRLNIPRCDHARLNIDIAWWDAGLSKTLTIGGRLPIAAHDDAVAVSEDAGAASMPADKRRSRAFYLACASG